MSDYLNDQYLSKDPPFDVTPEGYVDWTGNIYIARCGVRPLDGKIETGYCGKTYQFRSCWILGVGEMRAHVCTRCDLRRSIVTEALGRKKYLCGQLAKLVPCTPTEAFHQAYAAFGYLSDYRKPNLYPMESSQEKIVEFGYPPENETRLPYSD